ncbi:MAG: PLP-dependent aminotransferase family protein [Geminicoccaceae bacterium]
MTIVPVKYYIVTMTIWLPNLTDHEGPRYQALAFAIGRAIEEGQLLPGEKLPPQRDLAFHLGVTVGTITRAYGLAERRGLVRGEVGRGTFVRGAEPETYFHNPVVDGDDDFIKLNVNSQPDLTAQHLLPQSLIKLASGNQPIGELLAYTPRIGLADHRRVAAGWASRTGAEFDPETTLITGGAHQAILIAIAGLARPGDTVLTEALVYSGVKHIASRLGVTLKGVALDDEGLCPDALDAACRETKARLLLINPTAHNPTTATMSEDRRREITKIALGHDLIVIEDDVYGQLLENRALPIAAMAPERTVYITNASKMIAPNLRFGSISAPATLYDRLADAQADFFIMCPALMAAIFTQWFEDGTADDLVLRQRAEAAVRQEIADECLKGLRYRAHPYCFHLWLELPEMWRSSSFVDALRAHGVGVDPAFIFAVDPAHSSAAVRISLSAAKNRERLRHALEIVRSTLQRGPIGRRDTI